MVLNAYYLTISENLKILRHTVEGGPSLTILNGSGCFVEEGQTDCLGLALSFMAAANDMWN